MASGSLTLEEMFSKFAKSGDAKADGKSITLSQSNKWMEQAGVIGKNITTIDTKICFNKFKSRNLNFEEYEKFLQDLAWYKNVDYKEVVSKLLASGLPCCKLIVTSHHSLSECKVDSECCPKEETDLVLKEKGKGKEKKK